MCSVGIVFGDEEARVHCLDEVASQLGIFLSLLVEHVFCDFPQASSLCQTKIKNLIHVSSIGNSRTNSVLWMKLLRRVENRFGGQSVIIRVIISCQLQCKPMASVICGGAFLNLPSPCLLKIFGASTSFAQRRKACIAYNKAIMCLQIEPFRCPLEVRSMKEMIACLFLHGQ